MSLFENAPLPDDRQVQRPYIQQSPLVNEYAPLPRANVHPYALRDVPREEWQRQPGTEFTWALPRIHMNPTMDAFRNREQPDYADLPAPIDPWHYEQQHPSMPRTDEQLTRTDTLPAIPRQRHANYRVAGPETHPDDYTPRH